MSFLAELPDTATRGRKGEGWGRADVSCRPALAVFRCGTGLRLYLSGCSGREGEKKKGHVGADRLAGLASVFIYLISRRKVKELSWSHG